MKLEEILGELRKGRQRLKNTDHPFSQISSVWDLELVSYINRITGFTVRDIIKSERSSNGQAKN